MTTGHRRLWLGAVLLHGMCAPVGAEEVSIRPDLSSPGMIDRWILDGSGDWHILDDPDRLAFSAVDTSIRSGRIRAGLVQ